MTDFQKVLTEMPLDSGAHNPGQGACVMEKVAILWALHTGQDVTAAWSDLPACTNSVVAKMAQVVNDSLTGTERQRLNAFIPRLLRARRTENDKRINVRLAIWAARSVIDLAPPGDRDVCEKAIEAAEAWLENPCEETTRAAYTAAGAAYAAAAGAAAAGAAYAAAFLDGLLDAWEEAAAGAAYKAAAPEAHSRIDFLDGLLDAWEEAVTKEGLDLYVPREWEDQALAFVAEYMASA